MFPDSPNPGRAASLVEQERCAYVAAMSQRGKCRPDGTSWLTSNKPPMHDINKSADPLLQEATAAPTTPPPADTPQEAGYEPPKRKELIAYSMSASAENLSVHTVNTLATPLLNMGFGINPALISSIMAARGIFDAFTDPVFGQISDNFRSRWGRRRPFILAGSILIAICASCIWLFPASWPHSSILWWFGFWVFAMALATTIFSVSHVALGIEMAPTYKERTRVVAYKSVVTKSAGLMAPWIYPICLLPFFGSELVGARTVAIVFAVFVVVSGIWTFRECREKTHVSAARPKEKFLPAVMRIGRNTNFLRVTGVYILMLSMLQLFGIFGLYLNVYYVFQGDKTAGATIAATNNSIGSILALLSIPLITWLCNTIQKHNTLRLALCMMITGNVLNWFLLTPATPYAQLVIPFFYGLGISSVFVVLSSMQADLVDDDELKSGQRREGLFSCVAAWMMKSASSIAGAVSGFLIVWTGFDVNLGAAQPPDTIFWLRVFNSFAPGAMVLMCLLLLVRYPLTEQRVNEINVILRARRKTEEDRLRAAETGAA